MCHLVGKLSPVEFVILDFVAALCQIDHGESECKCVCILEEPGLYFFLFASLFPNR